ncbi:MAG TPA: LLM class flavin-dependent oxidoreductase [Stellaceae bacterium]|nr:LLM class flavin-dependent oxidoreductase [Stellaceae bacterium]
MEFGINFFPTHDPSKIGASRYYRECMELVALCDGLGFHHVRAVEHYFEPYGGFSPNPTVFLTAASQHSRKARLITGAVLPVFNNPLKLAGELGMLDGFSEGRLEIGFARAFLPHEFERFGIPLDESRARFEEGMAQVVLLLQCENASSDGRFHSFHNVTSLPRPVQQPHPPLWVAAFTTKESFESAGRNGHGIMAIPAAGPLMRELIGLYREAWRSAGHPGQGRVMLTHNVYCGESEAEVIATAKAPFNGHLAALIAAASGWGAGVRSKDYPGYEKMLEGLRGNDFDDMRRRGLAWCGTSDEICDMIVTCYRDIPGGVDIVSAQINFHDLPVGKAAASMRRFSERVMPRFRAG